MITEDAEVLRARRVAQSVAEVPLAEHRLVTVPGLHAIRHRGTNPPAGTGVTVVVQHQNSLFTGPVRVGKHVLVDVTLRGEEIVEQELANLREQVPPVEQRKDLPLVSLDEP